MFYTLLTSMWRPKAKHNTPKENVMGNLKFQNHSEDENFDHSCTTHNLKYYRMFRWIQGGAEYLISQKIHKDDSVETVAIEDLSNSNKLDPQSDKFKEIAEVAKPVASTFSHWREKYSYLYNRRG